MAMKYRVDDFFVDLTRNQITQGGKSQTLAPKALAVLTLLAKNQGSVITQEEILDSVWRGTFVNPNSLQRSIAQLRKALGDDAKHQRVIKTHTKQGYSLEADVSWDWEEGQHSAPPSFQSETQGHPQAAPIEQPSSVFKPPYRPPYRRATFAIGLMAGVLLLLGGLLFSSTLTSTPTTQMLSIAGIQALTATDNVETGAIYSADGEYIIFNRHGQQCHNQIWAKHIASERETLLTPAWANYGGASLSPDGAQLAFIERQSCRPAVSNDACFVLQQMDFAQALAGDTQTSTLMTCNKTRIAKPRWLSKDRLALMHKPNRRWQLITLSLSDTDSEILYQPREGNIVTYDFSHSASRLALIRLNEANQLFLDVLSAEGTLVSSNAVGAHPKVAANSLIYPNFIPQQDQLVFSTGKQLFSLSLDGQIRQVALPLDEGMGTPLFKPDGKRALATKGTFDSDIGTIDMTELRHANNIELSDEAVTNIERTNRSEAQAAYQPNGDMIAFESERSGTPQLWLVKGSELTQLTHLPMDTRIRGFSWAEDGESLLLNSNRQLKQVRLDGGSSEITTPGPITRLFHWDSISNSVIANMLVNGANALVEINLESGEYLTLKDGPALWAAQSTSGRLIYLDHHYQFWESALAEDILLTALSRQGSHRQFFLSGETVYGMNEEDYLWTYDLDQQTFTLLNRLPENIDYLSSLHNDKLVVSYVVAARKEIAELRIEG